HGDFVQFACPIFPAFAFGKSDSLTRATPNSMQVLLNEASTPITGDPNLQTRTTVSPDLRSPVAEQFALQFERQISANWALRTGYVGTKGTALFEQIDGNPALPGSRGMRRVDPTHGLVI